MHVFADESYRTGTYLVAAAFIDPRALHATRTRLRGLLMPGQREIHMKHEKPPRRRQLVDTVVGLSVPVVLYKATTLERHQEEARAACMRELALDAIKQGVRRLVLDSRPGRDVLDGRVLRSVLGSHPRSTAVSYEHLESFQEPLLWIADVAAWAYGAGDDWRRRILPLIGATVQCDS